MSAWCFDDKDVCECVPLFCDVCAFVHTDACVLLSCCKRQSTKTNWRLGGNATPSNA